MFIRNDCFDLFIGEKMNLKNPEITRYVYNFQENSSKLFLQTENGGEM